MHPLARQEIAERDENVPVDLQISELAEGQGGLATARQLRALGLSPSAIGRRCQAGRLHTVHRGIYAVGHRGLGPTGVRLAALWACGPRACFGIRTAAALGGLLADPRGRFDVIVPGRGTLRGPPNVDLHRTRRLPPEQITTAHGLPVTSVARTLVDLAGVVSETTLKRAIHEAEIQRTLDVNEVLAVIAQLQTRPGVGILRNVLNHGDAAPTADAFVTVFLALCREHGLPQPTVNLHEDTGLTALGQLDLAYRAHRVIIELDGAQTHMTRKQFEEDRRRDSYLAARGWQTLRYTWHRVTRDQRAVAAEIKAVLAQRSGTAASR